MYNHQILQWFVAKTLNLRFGSLDSLSLAVSPLICCWNRQRGVAMCSWEKVVKVNWLLPILSKRQCLNLLPLLNQYSTNICFLFANKCRDFSKCLWDVQETGTWLQRGNDGVFFLGPATKMFFFFLTCTIKALVFPLKLHLHLAQRTRCNFHPPPAFYDCSRECTFCYSLLCSFRAQHCTQNAEAGKSESRSAVLL